MATWSKKMLEIDDRGEMVVGFSKDEFTAKVNAIALHGRAEKVLDRWAVIQSGKTEKWNESIAKIRASVA